MKKSYLLALLAVAVLALAFVYMNNKEASPNTQSPKSTKEQPGSDTPIVKPVAVLDTALFQKLQLHVTNGDTSGKWPVKSAFPLPGALLPFKRIVAYYGTCTLLVWAFWVNTRKHKCFKCCRMSAGNGKKQIPLSR